jgi:hypothetical protein
MREVARCKPDFEGAKGRSVTAFKETITKFLKVLVVVKYKACNDDVSYTHFSRDNVPLNHLKS